MILIILAYYATFCKNVSRDDTYCRRRQYVTKEKMVWYITWTLSPDSDRSNDHFWFIYSTCFSMIYVIYMLGCIASAHYGMRRISRISLPISFDNGYMLTNTCTPLSRWSCNLFSNLSCTTLSRLICCRKVLIRITLYMGKNFSFCNSSLLRVPRSLKKTIQMKSTMTYT